MATNSKSATTDEPLDSTAAFQIEQAFIRGCPADKLSESLQNKPLSALCFSGGGIRSAATCLGVLQFLATNDALHKFDYLSTVSGGGYTGAWLSAWRKRAGGLAEVERILADTDPPELEAAPLINLRRRTNYLAPNSGVLGADTWTGIALYTRNVFLLNLLVMSLVAAVMLALKFEYLELVGLSSEVDIKRFVLSTASIDFSVLTSSLYQISISAGVLLSAIGWCLLASGRPSFAQRPGNDPRYLRLLKAGCFCMFISALLLSGTAVPTELLSSAHKLTHYPTLTAICVGALIGLVGTTVGPIFARIISPPVFDTEGRVITSVPGWWCCIVLIGIVAGGCAGMAYSLGIGVICAIPCDAMLLLPITRILSVTLFGIAFAIGEAMFLALSTRKISIVEMWNDRWGDEEREWSGRCVGYLLFATVIATLVEASAIFGSDAVEYLISFSNLKAIAALISSIVTFLGAIGLGTSGLTNATASRSAGKYSGFLRIVLLFATPLSIILLLLLVSAAVDHATLGSGLRQTVLHTWTGAWNSIDTPLMRFWSTTAIFAFLGWHKALLFCAALLLVLTLVLSLCLNVNRYSLHDLYRLRLTREFLGASTPNRIDDPWTGMDASDDIQLNSLIMKSPKQTGFPLYPVINATLNSLKPDQLQWGYRKGYPFTFTPHHSGSKATGYRDTAKYGGGILLGTAMAISGAAVSPNAGYSTMKGLSILLTLFNARLGVWAGNPKQGCWRSRGPTSALEPLINEATMRTSDTSKWIYLSDGGHFDNLGVYEMLRRRCMFVVAVDAGEDETYHFNDLGELVRRARLELNVEIEISTSALRNRPTPPADAPYYAVGAINYPDVQDAGRFIYIKSGYHGLGEPADVRAFAALNADFPHDPTVDQFFDESRFESYRALGYWIAKESLSALE